MIRRNTRIVLLLFVGVLLAALIISRNSAGTAEPTPTESPEPVWSLESSDIVGVTVEDLESDQVVELVRDEQDLWKMVRPDELAVDAARVERAVSWLAAPSPRAEILDAQELADYELDDPHFRISVTTAGGDQLVLTLGREAPTGGSRYASFEERQGVLVFSTIGLDEVLQLGPDLIPTATPTNTPTPTETATATPEATLDPSPEATQESGG